MMDEERHYCLRKTLFELGEPLSGKCPCFWCHRYMFKSFVGLFGASLSGKIPCRAVRLLCSLGTKRECQEGKLLGEHVWKGN